jgi:hypothetical protein
MTQSFDSSFIPVRQTLRVCVLAALVAGLSACGGGGGTTPYSLSGSGGSSSGSGSSSGGGSSGSGGGGATTTATPYGLFASTYIAYAAQTNGAYLHSIQGGDVITGGGGNYSFGGYSASQADMNRTGLYIIQAQAGTTAPTAAGDYYYVAVKAPGDASFDISQATNLVIQVGNSFNASGSAAGGHATVFQIGINDTPMTGSTKNSCTYNLSLQTEGSGVALSALGVRTYVIPLSSFTTCSTGSMAAMQSTGITTVAATIVGSLNTSVAAGEFNTIAVGNIGFTSSITAADTTALAL